MPLSLDPGCTSFTEILGGRSRVPDSRSTPSLRRQTRSTWATATRKPAFVISRIPWLSVTQSASGRNSISTQSVVARPWQQAALCPAQSLGGVHDLAALAQLQGESARPQKTPQLLQAVQRESRAGTSSVRECSDCAADLCHPVSSVARCSISWLILASVPVVNAVDHDVYEYQSFSSAHGINRRLSDSLRLVRFSEERLFAEQVDKWLATDLMAAI